MKWFLLFLAMVLFSPPGHPVAVFLGILVLLMSITAHEQHMARLNEEEEERAKRKGW